MDKNQRDELTALEYYDKNPKKSLLDLERGLTNVIGYALTIQIFKDFKQKQFFDVEKADMSARETYAGEQEYHNRYTLSKLGHSSLVYLREQRTQELFDRDVKLDTLANNRVQRNVTYISLLIVLLVGLLPLGIFIYERYHDKPTRIESIELQQIHKTQQALQQNVQDIQKILQKKDSCEFLKASNTKP